MEINREIEDSSQNKTQSQSATPSDFFDKKEKAKSSKPELVPSPGQEIICPHCGEGFFSPDKSESKNAKNKNDAAASLRKHKKWTKDNSSGLKIREVESLNDQETEAVGSLELLQKESNAKLALESMMKRKKDATAMTLDESMEKEKNDINPRGIGKRQVRLPYWSDSYVRD